MNTGILSNYAHTALRVLARNRLYSAINVLGLAAGLTCCILISLFVADELSYDRWLPDAERIDRLDGTFYIPGREPMMTAQSPGPARAALEKAFPSEIEQAVRIYRRRPTIDIGDKQFNDRLWEVDPEFFSVFALPFVAGDPATALADTSSLILTESMARKYFGDEPAVGRTVTITREAPETLRISGVIKDVPRNSHMRIEMITRFDPARYKDQEWVAERWTSVNMFTYIKFRSVAAAEQVGTRLRDFVNKNVDFGMPELEGMAAGDLLELTLQPVPRIHLHSPEREAFKDGGDIVTVWTFSAVALLILLIASMNFMNLATARSLQRAREVSLRKVLGASRGQLVVQFLGESVLLTLFALALALAAVELLLPWFNTYVDKELTFNLLANPAQAGAIVGLAVLVGVVGGLYPAFVLSAFRPAAILKANQSSAGEGSARLRATLVVIQFAISIGLIATTLVIWAQTRYARNLDPGYISDHMIGLDNIGGEDTRALQPTLLNEIRAIPGVIAAARASDSLPQQSSNNELVTLPGVQTEDLLVIEKLEVDYDLFPVLGVSPIAGRLYSRDYPADVMPPDVDKIEGPVSASVVLNRRAVQRLGFGTPEAAIGKTFQVSASEDKKADVTVVGVVDDMHFRSVRSEISPMMFYLADSPDQFYNLFVYVRSDDLPATLAAIDGVWSKLVPAVPIDRAFIDEEFAKLYDADEARMKMFAGFAAFAVFVACLGLFGLASFAADRRTREIGIRKVHGASVGDIVRLLVWQFSRPVLIANLIAWPAAWYFVQAWLEGFQSRIDVTPVPFLVAGGAALLIAWGTVILHARRVSTANPIKALRYE